MSSLQRTLRRRRKRIVMYGDENQMQPQTRRWVRMERDKIRMKERIEEMKQAEVAQKKGR